MDAPRDEAAQHGSTRSDSTRRVVVLSAPSGAGKTTIAHRLLERNPAWRFSVSATTRERRATEMDGRDYHFMDVEEFIRRREHGDLVEWEEIYGNFYGTLRSEVERLLAPGDSRVIFDVDVKGALEIRDAFPHDAFLVFIAPPSIDELKQRLMARNTESPETLARRIARAEMEMSMRDRFDVIVVNDDVARAVAEIEALLA